MSESGRALYSLDRWPDNDGNYGPGNGIWADRKTQAANKRNTKWVEPVPGRRVKLIDLCAERGVDLRVVYSRLGFGWPLEVALATATPDAPATIMDARWYPDDTWRPLPSDALRGAGYTLGIGTASGAHEEHDDDEPREAYWEFIP